MEKKKMYLSPDMVVMYVEKDVITYSEEDEWNGPVVDAGNEEEN